MKNLIQITPLLIFSIGFFVIGLLNWLTINPNDELSILYVNVLNDYHALEICVVLGAVLSAIQNYKRAKSRNPKHIFDATFLLFGFDFTIMLFGAFASQVVFLAFSFSNDWNLQIFVGAYGLAIIIVNILRKKILVFFTNLIH